MDGKLSSSLLDIIKNIKASQRTLSSQTFLQDWQELMYIDFNHESLPQYLAQIDKEATTEDTLLCLLQVDCSCVRIHAAKRLVSLNFMKPVEILDILSSLSRLYSYFFN